MIQIVIGLSCDIIEQLSCMNVDQTSWHEDLFIIDSSFSETAV